ncbi:hypothetical protein LTR95_003091 [Oleoguttula sp. CCFEE 5521]
MPDVLALRRIRTSLAVQSTALPCESQEKKLRKETVFSSERAILHSVCLSGDQGSVFTHCGAVDSSTRHSDFWGEQRHDERTALTSFTTGDKARQQQEEVIRSADNQAKAAGSYTPVEPDDVDTGDEDGLPWGSLSLRHIIVTGRAKEQSSRETSVYAAASRAGGSSRLGLHLVDQYARSTPAWTFWKTGSQWPAVPSSARLPSQREPIAQLTVQPSGAGVTRHSMK